MLNLGMSVSESRGRREHQNKRATGHRYRSAQSVLERNGGGEADGERAQPAQRSRATSQRSEPKTGRTGRTRQTGRLAIAHSETLPVAPVATSVPSKGTTVPPVAPTCGEASRCAAGYADEAEPALRTGYTTTRACTPQDRATALPLRCHTEPPPRGPGRASFCRPSSVPDAVFHTFR